MTNTYKSISKSGLPGKRGEQVELICQQCGTTFKRSRGEVKRQIKLKAQNTFCSQKCVGTYITQNRTWKTLNCKECGESFYRAPIAMKNTKNQFCSLSCATTYNNTHKKHGTRRSKLEKWLETELTKTYSNLEIHFNRKDAINSELDIYIPSLKLAIELNGIFHYEPIYGQEKLASIQNNDERKFQACLEMGIELCIMDVSQLNYFKPKKAQKYLDIITKIINSKL